MEEKIKELIQAELKIINGMHGPFVDTHHGHSLLHETVEELHEDVEQIEAFRQSLWDKVKENSAPCYLKHDVEYILQFSIAAIKDAIQAAARAQKFIDMLDREGTK